MSKIEEYIEIFPYEEHIYDVLQRRGVLMDLREMRQNYINDGYEPLDASAKVCQDILLAKISKSSLNRNITIKGGVVMHNISRDSRRATMDLDFDFIKYSLDDKSIKFYRKN